MKTIAILTLAAAGVLSVNAAGWADTSAPTAPATQPAAQGDHEGRLPIATPAERLERLRGLLHDLNLSDEEKGKIEEVVKPFREKLEAWRTDNKDAIEKDVAAFKTAREAKDKTQAKAALQELKTLFETAPKPKELIGQIEEVLTPEQKAKFEAKLAELKEQRQEKREARKGGTTAPAAAPAAGN